MPGDHARDEDGPIPRLIDAAIVAALFIGNGLLSLWGTPSTFF